MEFYNQVYDFSNENVTCLNDIYNFKNSKVLSVAGSGDHFFASLLNGAKQVDVFDINETSYLYLLLKFYSIRELTFEQFYELLVLKKFNNLNIYSKLEKVLPLEVLKYYKYLLDNNVLRKKKNTCFRGDGINLLSKKNQKYYFENSSTVIPYFVKEKYYKLQEILKNLPMPNFFKVDLLDLNETINQKYDILLTSNIYNHIPITNKEYLKLLNEFDIPQVQALYDWYGFHFDEFTSIGFKANMITPSSPSEYLSQKNYIYSIKK